MSRSMPIAIVGNSSRLWPDERTADVSFIDADFFGISAPESLLLAPPQRLLLECAWEALESAGYRPDWQGRIGMYVSIDADGQYFSNHLLAHPHLLRPFSD